MNEIDSLTVTDEDTARRYLARVAHKLSEATNRGAPSVDNLRNAIVNARTAGFLSVPQIAAAVGRNRNYVDAVWSTWGQTVRGKQTRVTLAQDVTDEARAEAFAALVAVADQRARVVADIKTARAERDRAVVMVYASTILGPTAIADAVGVDRNTVLRFARTAGVAPAHRKNSRNQYTVQA